VPIRRLTAIPLLAGAVAVAIALAGCSTPTPSGGTGGNGGSGGSEGTNGRPGSSQDDSGSGAGDSGSDGSGSGQPLSGRLPAGWPDDVVVPEGDIVQAVGMGSSYVALIDVDDPATAFASSSASLQAAGYTVVSEVASDHGSVGIYENAERQVQVAVATASEAGWTMSYTITEKG
jgi:hypothetical protein